MMDKVQQTEVSLVM